MSRLLRIKPSASATARSRHKRGARLYTKRYSSSVKYGGAAMLYKAQLLENFLQAHLVRMLPDRPLAAGFRDALSLLFVFEVVTDLLYQVGNVLVEYDLLPRHEVIFHVVGVARDAKAAAARDLNRPRLDLRNALAEK